MDAPGGVSSRLKSSKFSVLAGSVQGRTVRVAGCAQGQTVDFCTRRNVCNRWG